jgi:glycosyltransferase involved in cell wall biosynthesis
VSVSVVVANRDSGADLEECLNSLLHQACSGGIEVLVCDCSVGGAIEHIRSHFPSVRVFPSEAADAARALGDALGEAEGEIVVVTDANCRFPQGWLRKLQRAHDSDFAVIGGVVENGCKKGMLGWACYFADYGRFMLPAKRCETSFLAGNHVSYKRSLLERSHHLIENGFYKVFFHWALAKQGVRFLFDPDLVVYYVCPHTFSSFTSNYYCQARAFAEMRCRSDSRSRLMRLLSVPALPALLLIRRVWPVLGKRRDTGKLLLSIPALAVFATAWSAGEMAGYLRIMSTLHRPEPLS